jgi:hypothetical protein
VKLCGVGVGEELSALALIEVFVGNGLRFGGIELGALIEVVGEGFLGDREEVWRSPGSPKTLGKGEKEQSGEKRKKELEPFS